MIHWTHTFGPLLRLPIMAGGCGRANLSPHQQEVKRGKVAIVLQSPSKAHPNHLKTAHSAPPSKGPTASGYSPLGDQAFNTGTFGINSCKPEQKA